MALITAENLTLGYDSQAIVRDLNFKVEEGDYLCIVGENGSGKTTLMRTLLGLQRQIEGEIVLGEGLKLSDIGYLPQQTDVQRDFPASVTEIVMSGFQGKCGFRPFYNKAEKDQAKANMKRMSIDGFADRCYRDLSGGQQQRVLLARALCAAERILILDEPVTGLDPRVTRDMYDLIQSLNREGVTIIMISHDIHAAVKYADHILHIGDDIFFGTTEDYLRSEMGSLFAPDHAVKSDAERTANAAAPDHAVRSAAEQTANAAAPDHAVRSAAEQTEGGAE